MQDGHVVLAFCLSCERMVPLRIQPPVLDDGGLAWWIVPIEIISVPAAETYLKGALRPAVTH